VDREESAPSLMEASCAEERATPVRKRDAVRANETCMLKRVMDFGFFVLLWIGCWCQKNPRQNANNRDVVYLETWLHLTIIVANTCIPRKKHQSSMIRSTAFTRRLIASALSKRAIVASVQTNQFPINPTQNYNNLPTQPSPINIRSLSSSHLSSILTREIDEEISSGTNSNTLPPELESLYNEITTKWTIVQGITGIGSESGIGASVRMFKKENGSNGAKIGVVFHCQDTEEDHGPLDETMFYEDGPEEDTEEEIGTAVRFAVTVSKGGRTVVIQCRANESDLNVESVAVRDGDAEGALIALAGGEQLHSALYQVRQIDD